MSAKEAEENVKIKTTGLGAIFNYIQENKDTLAEETKPDPNSSWKNVPLDLLCDVGHGIPKSHKSQRISAFFCDVCQIDLNSQVTYDTHVAGIKHQKKARNLNHLEKGLGEGPKPPTRKIKGLSSTNIKILLQDTDEPALGLQYIVEVFPTNNESGEHDAMYLCELCCTEGPCGSVFAHIIGFKHKEKYLAMKYNLNNLSKPDMVREAKRVEKLEGKRLNDIKTIIDDLKYPWPSGKKPAGLARKRPIEETEDDDASSEISLSRDFARRGYDFKRHTEEGIKPSLSESKIAKVLGALRSCQVKTEEDADMAHQVSAHLVRALTDYKEMTGNPAETRLVQAKCDQILDLLYSIRKIASFSNVKTGEKSGEWKADVVDYGHGQAPHSEIGFGGGGGGASGYRTSGPGSLVGGYSTSAEPDPYFSSSLPNPAYQATPAPRRFEPERTVYAESSYNSASDYRTSDSRYEQWRN